MLNLDQTEHLRTLLRHRARSWSCKQRIFACLNAKGYRVDRSEGHPAAGRQRSVRRPPPHCRARSGDGTQGSLLPLKCGGSTVGKAQANVSRRNANPFDRLNAKTPAAISRGGRIAICGCPATASRTRGSSGPQGSRAAWPARCHRVRLRCSCRRWPGLPRGR